MASESALLSNTKKSQQKPTRNFVKRVRKEKRAKLCKTLQKPNQKLYKAKLVKKRRALCKKIFFYPFRIMKNFTIYLSTAPVIAAIWFSITAALLIEINRFFPDPLVFSF